MIKHGNNLRLAVVAFAACACFSHLASGGEEAAKRPLDSYPLSDRVWLGSFGADVEVDPAVELTPSRSGDLHWLLEDGERIAEGGAVALMGYQQIRNSAAQLEIDKARLPIRRRTAIASNREKKAGIQRQIDELHSRLAKTDLTPAEREIIGENLARRVEVERKQIESQIGNLGEQLTPEWIDEELRLELEQLEHDLVRSQLEHDELVRSMEIIAENDGILEIEKSGYVRPPEVVGHIRRTGHAVVAVPIADPDVRAEVPENLVITVSGPDGSRYDGVFTGLERGPGGRFATTTYFFDLRPGADGAVPPPELSGERMATIHRLLPEQARIVTKSPLLFSHAVEINQLGWAGFLNKTWPEARVVFIGPQSIALATEP
jgi:hypothetical protein